MKVIRVQEWGHKAVIIIGDYTRGWAIHRGEIRLGKC